MGFEPPMNGPIQDADTLRASSIKFVDATNGKRLPHELPLLSSVPFGWRLHRRRVASPEMEADGVIRRSVCPQVPPKVECRLTKWGRALCPAPDGLLKWAELRGKMTETSST